MKSALLKRGALCWGPVFLLLVIAPAAGNDLDFRLPQLDEFSVLLEGEGPFGADVRGLVSVEDDGWILWTETTGPFRLDPERGEWIPAQDGLPVVDGRTEITAIASCPSRAGFLAATLLDGWVFTSEDGGHYWSFAGIIPVRGEPMRDLVVHPGDPSRLLAASKHKVFLSMDGGASWTELFAPMSSNSISVDDWSMQLVGVLADRLQPGKVLFTTRHGGTLVTENWGHDVQWLRGNLPGPVDAAALDPTFGSLVYAAAGGDLYRSVDGGRAWDVITWSQRSSLGRVLSLAVDAASPTRLIALTPGALKVSKDGGLNWRDNALPVGEEPRVLEVHPLGAERAMLLATNRGVWESTDIGATWQPRSQGLRDVTVLALATDRSEEGTIWAATNRGLAVYDAFRSRWMWRRELGATVPEYLVLSRGTSQAPWLFGEGSLWSQSSGEALRPLYDVPSHLEPTSAAWWRDSLRVAAVSSDSVWFATVDPDGHFDIQAIAPHDEEMILPWLRVDSCEPGALLLGSGQLLQTADGRGWKAIPLPESVEWVWDTERADAACGAHLIATNRGLFLSDGSSWRDVGPGNIEVRQVVCDPSYVGRWFVRASGVVYMTTDSGVLWRQLDLPVGQVTALSLDTVSQRLVVGLMDDGVRWFRYEEDVVFGPRVEPIHVSPNPFREEAVAFFEILEASTAVDLRIYSIFGDLVRTVFLEGTFPRGGTFTWTWDGRDDDGNEVAAGVYVFRATVEGRPYGGKALHVR